MKRKSPRPDLEFEKEPAQGDPELPRQRRRWAFAGVAGVLLVLLTLRLWLLCPYRIPSSSMEPTLRGHDEETGTGGDTVVVCKAAYLLSDPERWDVVALHVDDPDGQGDARPVAMVKRVVGLPNETIEIRDGALVVDGRALELPRSLANVRYQKRGPHGRHEVRLGPGDYFVLGDHSYLSRDSREWGPVELDRIFGKVLAVVLPWERATWLSSEASAVETD